MASGNVSEATNAAVHANIVSVGYSGWTPAVDCSTLEKCKRTCKNEPRRNYFAECGSDGSYYCALAQPLCNLTHLALRSKGCCTRPWE